MGPSHGKERPETAGDPAEERKRMKMFYLGFLAGLITCAVVMAMWAVSEPQRSKVPAEPVHPVEEENLLVRQPYDIIKLRAETRCDIEIFDGSKWVQDRIQYELKNELIRQMDPFIEIETGTNEPEREYRFRARLDRGTVFSSLSQTGSHGWRSRPRTQDSSERQRPWLPSQSQLDFALNS